MNNQLMKTASEMLTVTSETIPGYRIIEVMGLVRGNTVRTRNFGIDFLAGLRNIVGGEVGGYTAMLSQSREQSIDRMKAEARNLGANAIVAVRITTSSVLHGAAEILTYGTAVRVERA